MWGSGLSPGPEKTKTKKPKTKQNNFKSESICYFQLKRHKPLFVLLRNWSIFYISKQLEMSFKS